MSSLWATRYAFAALAILAAATRALAQGGARLPSMVLRKSI